MTPLTPEEEAEYQRLVETIAEFAKRLGRNPGNYKLKDDLTTVSVQIWFGKKKTERQPSAKTELLIMRVLREASERLLAREIYDRIDELLTREGRIQDLPGKSTVDRALSRLRNDKGKIGNSAKHPNGYYIVGDDPVHRAGLFPEKDEQPSEADRARILKHPAAEPECAQPTPKPREMPPDAV